MTLDLEKYATVDGQTSLDASYFNSRWYAIVRRLHALELLSVDWASAIAEVQNYGLSRINDAVQPLIDSLKTDLTNLIAQGQADLTSQSAAVADKLAEVDAKLTEVETTLTEVETTIAAQVATVAEAVDTLRPRWKLLSTDTVSVEPYQQYVVRGGLLDIAGLMSLSADAQLIVEVN